MLLLACALAYLGFLALCLAMERHHEQVFRRRRIPARRRSWFRVAGWAALAASVLPCVASGWAAGTVLWCGVLTVSAGVLVLLLPLAPRLAVGLGPVLLALAVGAIALAQERFG